jgi:hypothetical protein
MEDRLMQGKAKAPCILSAFNEISVGEVNPIPAVLVPSRLILSN